MGGAIKRPPALRLGPRYRPSKRDEHSAGPALAQLLPGRMTLRCSPERVAERSESLSRSRCRRVRRAMASNPVWEICERVAEVQALLHDHAECSEHNAADVVAKAQAILSEPELLRAMFDVGYSRRTRRRDE